MAYSTCRRLHTAIDHAIDATLTLFSYASVAGQLWLPLRIIAMNPVTTFTIYILANIIFILTWWSISFIIRYTTPLGLLCLSILLIIYGLRQAAFLLVYPGQLDTVVHEAEQAFGRILIRKMVVVLESIQQVIQALQVCTEQANLVKNNLVYQYSIIQNFENAFNTMVAPLLRALEHVEKTGTLHSNGLVLLRVLTDMNDIALNKMPSLQNHLADEASEDALIEDIRALESSLEMIKDQLRECIPLVGPSIAEPKGLRYAMTQVIALRKPPKYIASLELMRSDLVARYNGEQIWIAGYNKQMIDAIFIPSSSSSKNSSVMLLCNPNGGLYEFHHMQSDWITFYHSMGCHVLIYNYRGYGRNTGSPSPQLNNADALAIIAFLKDERKISKIGVHGESVGGVVATYLAAHCPDIAVIVADRTFSTLCALSQRLIARWTAPALRFLMRWETDNVKNYFTSPCPKIVCSDPSDEIILDPASLKSGIALRQELRDINFDLPKPLPIAPQWPEKYATAQCRAIFPLSKCSREKSHAWKWTMPICGSELSEDLLRRFTFCIISIAHRAVHQCDAKKSEVSIEIGLNNEGEENERAHLIPSECNGKHCGLPFPQVLIGYVWMQLAAMDGYCGNTLLEAVELGGYERLRAWTASLLFWGSRLPKGKRRRCSTMSFERNFINITPISVLEVYANLQHLVAQYKHKLLEDRDIGFLYYMIEFLHDTLQRRWRQLDTADGQSVNEWLIPLHCGHNRNFQEEEKQQLIEILQSVGFVEGIKPL